MTDHPESGTERHTDAEPEGGVAEDIQRVATELGKTPTEDEYAEHGSYTVETVFELAETTEWRQALVELVNDATLSRIPTVENLRQDVRRVADEQGEPVPQRLYREHGQYSVPTVIHKLGDGSWCEALESIGVEPAGKKTGPEIETDELCEDVKRVAAEYGEPVTSQTYEEHGKWSATTVASRIGDGSWRKALIRLGLKANPKSKKKLSPNEVRTDVRRVAEEHGEPLTVQTYVQYGESTRNKVVELFSDNGSWRDALCNLGVEPSGDPDVHPGPATKRELQLDFERVTDELESPPSVKEYRRHGQYQPEAVANRLNGGEWPTTTQDLYHE